MEKKIIKAYEMKYIIATNKRVREIILLSSISLGGSLIGSATRSVVLCKGGRRSHGGVKIHFPDPSVEHVAVPWSWPFRMT